MYARPVARFLDSEASVVYLVEKLGMSYCGGRRIPESRRWEARDGACGLPFANLYHGEIVEDRELNEFVILFTETCWRR